MVENDQSRLAEPLIPEMSVYAAAATELATRGDRLVFLDEERPISLAELLGDTQALAAQFQKMGLVAGDVVAFQLPNWSEAAVVNLAASALGLVVSPLVPIYRHAELRFMLNDSGARIVFIPGTFRGFDYAAMYAAIEPELEHRPAIVQVRAQSGQLAGLEAIIARGREMPKSAAWASVPLDAVKLRLYTSGTTGVPKAVLHSQRTVNDALYRSALMWGLARHDCILMPSPVTHATGYFNALEMPFLLGTTAVLMDQWDPDRAVTLIDHSRATATVGATPFLTELTAAAQAAGSVLPSLRIFACGGAAVPPAVINAANKTMKHSPAFRVYGSSEAPYVTLGSPAKEDPVRAAETEGSVNGYMLRLADESDQDVAAGCPGEILLQGDGLFLGYADPEQTAASFTDHGWFRTGDVGQIDETGALCITDRIKDIIIRGGENISAREVEAALERHVAIREAAVVALPHERLGEGIFAWLIMENGSSLESVELADHLAGSELARQKYPEEFAAVADLPRTASGKVRKDLLRERAAALTKTATEKRRPIERKFDANR